MGGRNSDEVVRTSGYTDTPEGVQQGGFTDVGHSDNQDVELRPMRMFSGDVFVMQQALVMEPCGRKNAETY